MIQKTNKEEAGFTLIELLIVVAVLAILATVVFIGIDPLARFQDTRNTKRQTDIANILSAIKMYAVDTKGTQLSAISSASIATGTVYMIGTSTVGPVTTGCAPAGTATTAVVNLMGLVTATGATGGYLPAVPVDPNASSNGYAASSTGYYIIRNENKTYTVGTCAEELGTNATVPVQEATR